MCSYPEKDFALPSTFTGYVLDNGGIFTRDFKTGERRVASEQVDPLRCPACGGQMRIISFIEETKTIEGKSKS